MYGTGLRFRPHVSQALDPRARNLLRALIAQYIRDGVPVGSRTLSRSAGLDVSPATIRNEMAALAGVKVRLLFDAIGSLGADRAIWFLTISVRAA